MAGREEAEIIVTLTAAQEMAVRLGWARGLLFCKRLMGGLHLVRGQTREARDSYLVYLGTYRQGNMAWGVLKCLEKLGDPTHKMHGLEETFHWAGTYFACSRKTKNLGHTYQSLRCLGDVLLAYGYEVTAMNVFHAVLAGSTEMDVHRRKQECLDRIGDRRR
ncbi:hypothetical protein C8R44DRAFT_773132 [Mycena epipterygia]|nr:hypothetical protein C8R44DRAFT_773132 [Mycena epipterygia]